MNINWDIIRGNDEVARLSHLMQLSDKQLAEVNKYLDQLNQPGGSGVGKRFAKGLLKYGVGKPLQAVGRGVRGAASWLNQGDGNPNNMKDPFGNLGVNRLRMPKFNTAKKEVKVMDERFAEVKKRIENPAVPQDMKDMYTRDYDLWKRYRSKLGGADKRSRGWISYFSKNLMKIERAVGIMPAN